ncbi:cell wall anchor protein [Pelomyxa schiedti]|nr:cell wall anchor protein [Pelomyxa schiedti]
MDQLRQALTCPVCLGDYASEGPKEPRLLTGCSHSLCSECLATLLSVASASASAAVSSCHTTTSTSARGVGVVCPLDRVVSVANPALGVDQFKKNYALLDVINTLSMLPKSPVATTSASTAASKSSTVSSPCAQGEPNSAHSYALYAWGYNRHGQVGAGDLVDKKQPVHVTSLPLLSARSSISAGGGHSALLLENGDGYLWGRNMKGEVGYRETEGRPNMTPVIPTLPTRVRMTMLCCGAHHTIAAIQGSSDLLVWGDNTHGQLGLGKPFEPRFSPVFLSMSLYIGRSDTIASLSAGCYHSVAVLGNGSIFVWGRNHNNQIGSPLRDQEGMKSTPTLLDAPGISFRSVACGCRHTVGLTVQGEVVTWGGNRCGELGRPTSEATSSVPKALSLPGPVRSIQCGCHHTIALLESGIVMGWGSNRLGETGRTNVRRHNPVPTPVFDHTFLHRKVTTIACGGYHTCFILDTGTLWYIGSVGAPIAAPGVPVSVNFPVRDYEVIAVCCGWSHTIALLEFP